MHAFYVQWLGVPCILIHEIVAALPRDTFFRHKYGEETTKKLFLYWLFVGKRKMYGICQSDSVESVRMYGIREDMCACTPEESIEKYSNKRDSNEATFLVASTIMVTE